MATDYATVPEIKNTLTMNGETFADPDIALALAAASRGIDNLTGRWFYKDPDASQVRHYSPDNAHMLWIDDLVDLTTLQADPGGDGTFEETWTLNSDFILEPLNAPANGKPWGSIIVHPRTSKYLPCYPRSVKITGRFGWPAVPEPIKAATVMLASRLMKRAREAPFGVVTAGLDEAVAVHLARTDPDISGLVGQYQRTVV